MIFCNRIYVNKAQRIPSFTFFGTMRHFLKEKNSKISSFSSKKYLLRFLSLRYSADFRRSRLDDFNNNLFNFQSTFTFLNPRFSSRLLQWLVFFRQTTDLIVYIPLFSTDFNRFTGNPAVTGSSPCFSQKLYRAFAKTDETEGSPLSFFSDTATFSKKTYLQRVPFKFFMFCNKLDFQNVQRVPPFTILKTLRFFEP